MPLNFKLLPPFSSQTKGIVTVLVPGGAHEARNWAKDEMRLYLKKRKGFIKLALRFGVDLVPTFSFNEQFIYNQILAEKGNVLLLYNLAVLLSISLLADR